MRTDCAFDVLDHRENGRCGAQGRLASCYIAADRDSAGLKASWACL